MATKSILYDKRMVAFLDILGFERIVDKSRDDTEIVRKLANMLMSSKSIALRSLQSKLTVLKVDPTRYVYRAFSDTSVITGPYTSHDDLVFLSTWVMYYQYHLWRQEKSFLRGAIVYGDIYQDRDVMFGPAIIDAYHLERDTTKAMWPRVLIGESLLAKVTEPELKRDLFDIFRRDNDMVYCDYLREFFHLMTLAALEKIIGKREQDFGDPVGLFGDHQEAILTQVGNTLEEEKEYGKRNAVIGKYVELSNYHNATIDVLCQAIDYLLTNSGVIGEVFQDMVESDSHRRKGIGYTPRYSAEDHPEQSDMLDIVGLTVSRVLHNNLGVDSGWEEALDTLNLQVPKELAQLRQSLVKLRMDLDGIKAHL
jgi:hypothetical protein